MDFITPEEARAKWEKNEKAAIVKRRQELVYKFCGGGPLEPYVMVHLVIRDESDLEYIREQLSAAHVWNDLPEFIQHEEDGSGPDANCERCFAVKCKYANFLFGEGAHPAPESRGEEDTPTISHLVSSVRARRDEEIAARLAVLDALVREYLANPLYPGIPKKGQLSVKNTLN